MGLSLPKSNLIFLKKCLDKWVHFNEMYWNDAKNVSASKPKVINYNMRCIEIVSRHLQHILSADKLQHEMY